MTQELKPCPFCGAALSENRSEISGEQFSYWTHPKNECLFLHGHTVSRHEIEDWNRRASPWQPIETAPNKIVVLFFGITCRREDGSASNWKMATGVRYKNEGDDGDDVFEWDGRKLKSWEIKPTHWLELPDPPEVEK